MKTPIQTKYLTPKEGTDSDNNIPHLFKPLPINQRLIRKTENNITFPISAISNDSNIPLIYPQFQFGSLSNLNMNSSPQLRQFLYQEKNKNKKIIDIRSTSEG